MKYLRLLSLVFVTLPVVALPQTVNFNSDLLLAARKGSEATVLALLDQGASVNSRNRLGDTPLLIAAKNGYTSMGLKLIERGADVNARDNRGKTAAVMAEEGGHHATLKLLRHP